MHWTEATSEEFQKVVKWDTSILVNVNCNSDIDNKCRFNSTAKKEGNNMLLVVLVSFLFTGPTGNRNISTTSYGLYCWDGH